MYVVSSAEKKTLNTWQDKIDWMVKAKECDLNLNVDETHLFIQGEI